MDPRDAFLERARQGAGIVPVTREVVTDADTPVAALDRKSTRLNSSHLVISYAVFCLKKKKASLRNNTMNADKTNYDLLYNPQLVVKNYQAIFDRLEKHSERAHATLECYLYEPYGFRE